MGMRYGLSTDPKPAASEVQSEPLAEYIEIDTDDEFVWDATRWRRKTPRLAFEDDFDKGRCGWIGQTSGNFGTGTVDKPWPMLVPEARSGSTWGLKIFPGAGNSRNAWAVKRLHRLDKLVRWSGGIGWGLQEQNTPNYLRYFNWIIDYQSSAGVRYWYEVRFTHYDEAGGGVADMISVETGDADGGGSVTTDVYGSVAENAYNLGFNDSRKVNFHHFAVEFDLGAHKYHALTLDDTRFDLSGYGPEPSGAVANYNNGMNLILGCYNRTNQPSGDPYIILDRPKLEVLD